MIDDKPVRFELSIAKTISDKITKTKGLISGLFDFLRNALKKEESILYIAPAKGFIRECADIFSESMVNHVGGIVVTFDTDTRELLYNLEDEGIDKSKLFFI